MTVVGPDDSWLAGRPSGEGEGRPGGGGVGCC